MRDSVSACITTASRMARPQGRHQRVRIRTTARELVNSSTGSCPTAHGQARIRSRLDVSVGNTCAHFFANRTKRSIRSRPSGVRVTGQMSQMRVSETARKRARVKAAVASAAVVNTTMIRDADAAASPKLTALGMQQNCTSSVPGPATTSTYMVKVSVVFLPRHRSRSETMTICMSLARLMILCTGSLDRSGTHTRPSSSRAADSTSPDSSASNRRIQ